MPDDDPEDPACSHGEEQGLKGELLGPRSNDEEIKGCIDLGEDPTFAKGNIDIISRPILQIDEDTKVAESKQYHENDDLTDTDVSNNLLRDQG